MTESVRVLIVERQFVVRQGVAKIVTDRFSNAVVGEAATGEAALELVWKGTWDVVFLDIMTPSCGGLDTLRRLKLSRPQMPVIVLSSYSEKDIAVRALKLGAAGYLKKDSTGLEYIESLDAALRGARYLTPAIAGLVAASIAQRPKVAHEALSGREFQVLCMIGSGKTVKEVAGELALSLKTVSTYRSRILEKLSLRNNLEIVRYAVRHSLVEIEQTPEN